MTTRLVVGLGNPGGEYVGTRHNIGYWALDSYALNEGVTFKNTTKFNAEIAEISHSDCKVRLVKPLGYYNTSGEIVRAIAQYYNVASCNILVVHDELSIPIGKVRARIGGSDAGNNGIKSINTHVGLDTMRLRVGIDTDMRINIDDANYVLGRLTELERTHLTALLPAIHTYIDAFINGSFEATTHTAEPKPAPTAT